MTAPTVAYTEESRRVFLRSVANKVDEVADAASAGPWLLSQAINDAIQVRPAPDNSERHLCGLIDPNDARAVVAADPENLRSLADAMREAATSAKTPSAIIDALCDVAQRWDTAMLLRCSGVLQIASDRDNSPRPNEATDTSELTVDTPPVTELDGSREPASAHAGASAAATDNVWA